MMFVTAIPAIPWTVLWQVLSISVAFCLSAVVLFGVAMWSISLARRSNVAAALRGASGLLSVVALAAIAYLAIVGLHYITTK
jgi:hypothetical protein